MCVSRHEKDDRIFILPNNETEMKKIYALLLLAAFAAAGCNEKEVEADPKNDRTDITEKFDPLFAEALQQHGYIADATHIELKDVAGIEELDLECRGQHEQLTSLRGIEYFTALKTLNCSSNVIETMDFSKNKALTELDCGSNHSKTLNVSGCTALKILYCGSNNLGTLDLSSNKALTEVDCFNAMLTSLNLAGNTALIELS